MTRFVSSRNSEALFCTGLLSHLLESLCYAVTVLPCVLCNNLSSEKMGTVFRFYPSTAASHSKLNLPVAAFGGITNCVSPLPHC